MLLRNLDITAGLCNGTHLIITRMGRYVLEGRVISGSNIGDKVYVPRLSLQPSTPEFPSSSKAVSFLLPFVLQ